MNKIKVMYSAGPGYEYDEIVDFMQARFKDVNDENIDIYVELPIDDIEYYDETLNYTDLKQMFIKEAEAQGFESELFHFLYD